MKDTVFIYIEKKKNIFILIEEVYFLIELI